DPPFGHLLTVNKDRPDAALAHTRAIGDKLVSNRRFARRKRLRRGNSGPLQAKEVVRVRRLAILHIETPAAEPSSLGENHTVGAALGNLHIGANRMRLVLQVDEDV